VIEPPRAAWRDAGPTPAEQSATGRHRWLRVAETDRPLVLDGLFADGPEYWASLERFAMLMLLSVVIASLGLLLNSPAVVIGAMLVAPLVAPTLALAMALAMALPHRQLQALAAIAGGCAGGIATAWLVAALIPAARIAELPSELLARTAPTLLDLAVGVAAGAAGAYVTVRPRASAALPGVAIAVALVPPLAATGILLQHGDHRLAGGAALLLVTNLAAILLAATLVFLVVGFTPEAHTRDAQRRMRLGIATALLAVLAVAYPLERQSSQIITRSTEQASVGTQTQSWLGDRDVDVQDVTLDPADRFHIIVSLIGAPPLPSAASLAETIAQAIGHPITLTMQFTARSQQTVHGAETAHT
jgi:uncharacterized hydrophobic protein (TIGR00271 family)